MDIAMLFGEVGFVSHKNVIDGILEQAKRDGNNLYLFTCSGWHVYENPQYRSGEYSIFGLPDFENYDGVIVDLDTIHDAKISTGLQEKLEDLKIPCVSYHTQMLGASVIHMENSKGIFQMVEHVVQEHGAKNVHFISGPMFNQDARERRTAFLDAMACMGLGAGEENISYGDFSYESGRKAIGEYIARDCKLPDAFIAANDYMAIGAIDELHQAGIRVPEDVIVTGYDNCDMAQEIEPVLTTVDRREYKAGVMAYRKLMNRIAGEAPQQEVIVGKPVFRESCGCRHHAEVQSGKGGKKLVEQFFFMDNNLEILKNMTIKFFNMENYDDFANCMHHYIEEMQLEYFYLCLCGSKEERYRETELMAEGKIPERDTTVFADNIQCPLAYEKGEWTSYPTFSKKHLLPPERLGKGRGDYYIVMPVHQDENCIGYCVIGNYKNMEDGKFLQHLVLNIDYAMGNIRKQDIMRTMLARINQKWMYDELTGICNRSGLWKQSEAFMEKARKEQRLLAVLFFDLDGLKSVNDIHGHEAGDRYIRSMADILRICRKEEDILVRYGGDEYILVTAVYTQAEIEQYIDRIVKRVEAFNVGGCGRPLSVSIGYSMERSSEKLDLERLIEEADRNMYLEKRKKKHTAREIF